MWIRTCQECGYRQVRSRPAKDKELSTAYTNAKCRQCGSEALDYGKEGEPGLETE